MKKYYFVTFILGQNKIIHKQRIKQRLVEILIIINNQSVNSWLREYDNNMIHLSETQNS